MSIFFKVKKIVPSKYKSAQFADLFFYFSDQNKARQQVYTLIKCKLYLINGFQTNILGINNILSSKDFVINITKNCALIENCKVTIFINIRQQRQFLGEKLFASNNNIVLPYSKMMILFILVSLPNNHNFMFHPINQANIILYTYIFNHITTKFLLSNIFDCSLLILRYQKLGHIIDIYFENCFLANA